MALTLPAADWRTRPGLDRLGLALGADDGGARYVGGAVRDTLLGLPVSDIDVATIHAPDEVVRRLQAAGIKAIPTGIAHGTITAVTDGTVVEVTTLRRDVTTDGRHAEVAFTDDWRADAARRDFTINALYADMSGGAIHDYFGGTDDLATGRVRFIGDPLQRIAEDHLRILRFFRFLARFGDTPDADGLAACTARANDLMALSRERIADEVRKLLVARDAVGVVRLMVDRGIFRPVLPEIDSAAADRLAGLTGAELAAGVAPDAIRRLAALLTSAQAEGVTARLKLSKAQRKRVALALGRDEAMAPEELGYRIGVEGAVDRLLLGRDVAAAMRLSRWERPAFPLTGGALVERGLARGPDVARALRMVEDRWIAEGFPDAARTAAIADAVADQWLRAVSNP
ncbi:polynucleotide adenylyltransferase [Sphingomonas sp. Leaf407]|uniref:CCA tRNA nucleotidyltransferase n=1 Tax=unclassified Sphingomonas TaxID=196159 RepID=UPI0006F216BA|nr:MULTISPECIES: CCA tRNA nucleotidyltransferase [unclassified Sphingomonas]KQN37734.1 polynucleotide adenylyltransferase [Sphingomonas sp. Leaf42]KQT28101.1 polynucleotide adenylyltransferase [Sphingomonas sp. Leaf407]